MHDTVLVFCFSHSEKGASGVYSTPDDVLTWLEFHLNTRRDSSSCAASRHDHLNKRSEVPFAEEVRRIHHAVWLQRLDEMFLAVSLKIR
jgi:hypothetical protein